MPLLMLLVLTVDVMLERRNSMRFSPTRKQRSYALREMSTIRLTVSLLSLMAMRLRRSGKSL